MLLMVYFRYIVSFGDRAGLDPVSEILINRSESALTFRNIVTSGDCLSVERLFVWLNERLELSLVSRAPVSSVTIELQNFIAVVLGQDRAHLDVGDSHSTSVFFLLACQVLVHLVALVLADHVLIVGLCHSHHSLVARLASQVDIWRQKLVFESDLIFFLLPGILIHPHESILEC